MFTMLLPGSRRLTGSGTSRSVGPILRCILGGVIIHQYAVGRPFEVIKLATPGRPDKNSDNHGDQDHGDRDKQVDYFHNRVSIVGIQFARDVRLLRRMAFAVTISELKDMPMAAIHGASRPAAARGSASRL